MTGSNNEYEQDIENDFQNIDIFSKYGKELIESVEYLIEIEYEIGDSLEGIHAKMYKLANPEGGDTPE
jgi:hypothetical protein